MQIISCGKSMEVLTLKFSLKSTGFEVRFIAEQAWQKIICIHWRTQSNLETLTCFYHADNTPELKGFLPSSHFLSSLEYICYISYLEAYQTAIYQPEKY